MLILDFITENVAYTIAIALAGYVATSVIAYIVKGDHNA